MKLLSPNGELQLEITEMLPAGFQDGNLGRYDKDVGDDFTKQYAFSNKDGIYRAKFTAEMFFGMTIEHVPGSSNEYSQPAINLMSLPLDANGVPIFYSINAIPNMADSNQNDGYSFENDKVQEVVVELCIFGKPDKFYDVSSGITVDVENGAQIENLYVSSSFFNTVNFIEC